ncbi:hypothetical protein N9W18_01200 [Planktomarina sp.]|nr:hypothetical protein [Planktomarina sp.]
MKILILFADMIRQNRLSVLNNDKLYVSEFDNFIKSIGGTYYSNCFTMCPDTPRSLATLYSGLSPQDNGCDTAVKWPQYFMNDGIDNLFQMLFRKGYKIDFLSDPVERSCGIFPQFVIDNCNHNEKYSVKKFFKNLSIEEKHVIFACFPQFHWTLSAIGASTYGEKQGFKNLTTALLEMQRYIALNDFDHVFLFSDHGYKLSYELKFNQAYTSLNEDRTNVLFLHKRKGKQNLSINDSICSLTDFKSMMSDIVGAGSKSSENISLPERRCILIEDHLRFNVGVTDMIERWALKTPTEYYIRDLDAGYLKSASSKSFALKTVDKYDELLQDYQSFRNVAKIKNYRFLYSHMLKQDYIEANDLYDVRQLKIPKVISFAYKVVDILKKGLGIL